MTGHSNKEILFYYESRQNPNGDPGFENQPRLMPDSTIMVTDVRIKRTIRDYARDVLGKILFVDYGNDGNAVTADTRAKQILGGLKGKDAISELIQKTYDVPLFGALLTIRAEKGSGEGDSFKLTGPVQFGLGRSVNKVRIVNPTITGRFVGSIKGGEDKKQFSTFGKFYSVEYALIKIHGAVSPRNLGKYSEDKKTQSSFKAAEEKLFECLWNGTNGLITRSKFPQRSVLYLDVEYDGAAYNDLPQLVDEIQEMHDYAQELNKSPFIFSNLVKTLSSRASKVKKVRVAYCDDIKDDVQSLVKDLRAKSINVEEIRC